MGITGLGYKLIWGLFSLFVWSPIAWSQQTTLLTPSEITPQFHNIEINLNIGGEEVEAQTIDLIVFRPNPDGTLKHQETHITSLEVTLDGNLESGQRFSLPVPANLKNEISALLVKAELKGSDGNVVMDTPHPHIYRWKAPLTLNLKNTENTSQKPTETENFEQKLVSLSINLPSHTNIKPNSDLHISLAGTALAGANSLFPAGQRTYRLNEIDLESPIDFPVNSFIDDTGSVLTFNAWITDIIGRKYFVMRNPVIYTDSETKYTLRLDALKQGADTKVGKNLDPSLMAQALVHGEALFDPSNGLPGGARLRIALKRPFNTDGQNRLLNEQIFLLNSFKDRIPFSLATQSTYFDPYIPAPILQLTITDSNGRIYYDSGEVTALEGQNLIRLYPNLG